MLDKIVLSNRIKELRTQRQITQDQVAQGVGRSRSVVTQWESGTRMPSITALWELADFYGVTVDFLIGRSDG